MSYDVGIGEHSFNYTSNLAPLFYDHIPMRDARGGLSELDGKTGREALEILTCALADINRTRYESPNCRAFCAKYDAPNGWGSTVGAVLFLAQIMGACALNPRKLVSVSS